MTPKRYIFGGILSLLITIVAIVFLERIGHFERNKTENQVELSATLNPITDNGPAAPTWRVTYYPKNGSGVVLWWPVKKYYMPGEGLLTFVCADGKEFTISGDYLLEQL